MKKWIKIAGLLALMLPVAAPADDFTYITNADNTITITKYTGSGGGVTIPDTTNGLPVTIIGFAAFESCTSLTNVIIPDSVTNIEKSAFWHCANLTSISIPDSTINIGDFAFSLCYSLANITIGNGVTDVGIEAFYSCTNLTVITLPGSVTNIARDAFSDCDSLTEITVDEMNSAYSSVNGVLFDKEQTVLIKYPTGKTADSYTIPNSVTNIAIRAFNKCGLTSITIPTNVTGIKNYVFSFCRNLTAIVIPASVTNIGDNTFLGCWNLKDVYFLGNAPSINAEIPIEFLLLNATVTTGWGDSLTVYYLPRTSGWSDSFGGSPTALWEPKIQTGDSGFGIQTNGFGFDISWASGMTVVVEACTNLAEGIWVPVETNTLTGGSVQFSDPAFTNYPNRYYRVSMPQ
jgi:hypothetical protein